MGHWGSWVRVSGPQGMEGALLLRASSAGIPVLLGRARFAAFAGRVAKMTCGNQMP